MIDPFEHEEREAEETMDDASRRIGYRNKATCSSCGYHSACVIFWLRSHNTVALCPPCLTKGLSRHEQRGKAKQKSPVW